MDAYGGLLLNRIRRAGTDALQDAQMPVLVERLDKYTLSQKFVDLCHVSCDYFCLLFISLRKSVNCLGKKLLLQYLICQFYVALDLLYMKSERTRVP